MSLSFLVGVEGDAAAVGRPSRRSRARSGSVAGRSRRRDRRSRSRYCRTDPTRRQSCCRRGRAAGRRPCARMRSPSWASGPWAANPTGRSPRCRCRFCLHEGQAVSPAGDRGLAGVVSSDPQLLRDAALAGTLHRLPLVVHVAGDHEATMLLPSGVQATLGSPAVHTSPRLTRLGSPPATGTTNRPGFVAPPTSQMRRSGRPEKRPVAGRPGAPLAERSGGASRASRSRAGRC